MEILEWLRFLCGGAFLLCGVIVFLIEIIGVFRFKYVLNRMHAAALGDTFGIGLSIIGLIIFNGFCMTSLKLLCVVLFLWFSSPVSSHLIARLEVTTDEKKGEHYRILSEKKLMEQGKAKETEGEK